MADGLVRKRSLGRITFEKPDMLMRADGDLENSLPECSCIWYCYELGTVLCKSYYDHGWKTWEWEFELLKAIVDETRRQNDSLVSRGVRLPLRSNRSGTCPSSARVRRQSHVSSCFYQKQVCRD